jgi:N-acetylmuramoyl-L-alanine amidase
VFFSGENMKKSRGFLGCFFLLSLSFSMVFASSLKNIELKEANSLMQILLTTDALVKHKEFSLSNPERLVIDLPDTHLACALTLQSKNSFIKKIRSGQPRPGILRLVFELNQKVHMQVSQTTPKSIQLQLKALKASSKQNLAKVIPVKPAPPLKLRDVVVVIDAGHGGKDSGARGPHQSLEKNVVLSIALKLKNLIDKQPGMRAVMTRRGDYYIGLRQRLALARKFNGDIFVSIHADAFINQHSHGSSVFALSQRGATSEAARWIAEKENYSELGGVNLSDLDDHNGVVRSVLIDLSQTATIRSSLQMGNSVLQQIGKMASLHNHNVEQARFMVLKSPDIPSILVETGFISNPYEERNLKNANYQSRLSYAIFQGIKNYFWTYPPHGTRIASMSQVGNKKLL